MNKNLHFNVYYFWELINIFHVAFYSALKVMPEIESEVDFNIHMIPFPESSF